MNRKIIRNITIVLILMGASAGLLSAFWDSGVNSATYQNQSEKINLALRRTAHLLLKEAGDSTSTIEPITQSDMNTYLVKLEHYFNYDSLPTFLNSSLSLHGINERYDVEVWDCKNGTLLLGYNSVDILNGLGVPCGGRLQTLNCLNFKVIFSEKSPISTQQPFVYILMGSLLTFMIGAVAYYFYKPKFRNIETFTENIEAQVDEKSSQRIGKCIFDVHNQLLFIDNTSQKLTFREAKLLNLFSEHKNELLDRDFILKSVWEDEGVLVGRSVDVFVSRLRKILKDDDTIKIVNVHGRGYRFEVTT